MRQGSQEVVVCGLQLALPLMAVMRAANLTRSVRQYFLGTKSPISLLYLHDGGESHREQEMKNGWTGRMTHAQPDMDSAQRSP
jgi:hypothetical protein